MITLFQIVFVIRNFSAIFSVAASGDEYRRIRVGEASLNPSATPIRVNLRFLSIESFNFLTANKRE
jgi:hypothetical protein